MSGFASQNIHWVFVQGHILCWLPYSRGGPWSEGTWTQCSWSSSVVSAPWWASRGPWWSPPAGRLHCHLGRWAGPVAALQTHTLHSRYLEREREEDERERRVRERGKRGKSSVDDRHICGTLRDKNINIFRVVLNEVKTHTAQLCTSPECAVRQNTSCLSITGKLSRLSKSWKHPSTWGIYTSQDIVPEVRPFYLTGYCWQHLNWAISPRKQDM